MANTTIIFHDAHNGKIVEVLAVETAPGSGIYRLGMSDAATITIAAVEGEGTPGTPVGDLLTVQGDPAGTPIPVTLPAALVDTLGISGARFTSADASAVAVPVISAPGGVTHAVISTLVISVGVAPLTVYFTEETSTTALLDIYMAALSTTVIPLSRLRLVTANKRLMVQTSGAGAISVSAIWRAE